METTQEQRRELNRESLSHLRAEGILIDDESLALDVDKKIDAGQELTEVEVGILWHAITQEQADFVKQHLL